MDAAQVLQTVLSVIQSQNGGGDAGANATVAAVSPPSSQGSASAGAPLAQAALAAGSLSLPQLLFALVSSSAVRDWVKLLLVGAFFETCRRLLMKVWEDGGDYLWLTATFEWDDETSGAY